MVTTQQKHALERAEELYALAEQDRLGYVAKHIGPTAKPKRILVTTDLPKTRSGKIMRRLLKDAAEGKTQADATALATLADLAVMEEVLAGMHR